MLHKIASLVGQNVDGMSVDLRTYDENGSLHYPEFYPNPVMGKLQTVEIRKIKDREGNITPWLYWMWHPTGLNLPWACGYSGIANKWDKYYIKEKEAHHEG